MIKGFFSSFKKSKSKKEQRVKGVHSMLLALEPRIVFDGALVATGAEVAGDGFVEPDVSVETSLADQGSLADSLSFNTFDLSVMDNNKPVISDENMLADQNFKSDSDKISLETQSEKDSFINDAAAQGLKNNKDVSIAFVDTRIKGYEQIVSGLDENVNIYLIDNDDPGPETLVNNIKDFTKDNGSVDSIMIFSHGGKGWFSLGDEVISSDSLKSEHAATFTSLSSYLDGDADILIYGCNTAEGEAGESLIKDLSVLTKADIAASDNITGSKDFGGDWTLERQEGDIEKDFIKLSDSFDGFNGILAAPSLSDAEAETRMVDEDSTLTFNNLNVSGTEPVTITISLTENSGAPSNGSFSLDPGAIGNLSFSTGDGTNDATMTFEGNLSDINDALNGMIYSPSANYNGTAELSFSMSNTDGGPFNSIIDIEVVQKNDAPDLVTPGFADPDVATVNEGAGNTITLTPANFGVDATNNSTLGLFDADLDDALSTVKQQSTDQLTFELLSEPDPVKGRLLINENPLLTGSLFTLKDLIEGNVKYEHQGEQASTGASTQDNFNVIIRDGATGTDTGTINIKILPVNQAPSPEGSINVTPYEGRNGIDVKINVSDPDQSSSTWKIDFSNLNLDGGVLYLEKGGNSVYNPGTDIQVTNGYSYTGTLAGLNSELNIDISDLEPSSAITFDVTATDDDGGENDGGTTPADGDTGTSTITINQVENNDHPILIVNQGNDPLNPYSVPVGNTTINMTALLGVTDPDSPDTNITYTLTTGVVNTNTSGGTAEIRLNDSTLQSENSFTQDDVNKGFVRIVFTGSDGAGLHDFNFGFSVRDGELTPFSVENQALYGSRIEGGTRNDADDAYLDENNSPDLNDLLHQFNFRITDPVGSGAGQAPIPVNQNPVINVVGITSAELVEEGVNNTIIIGTDGDAGPRIEITDDDNSYDEITIRLEKLPTGGKIQVDGKDLELFGTFTQQQLKDGKVTFVHNGGEQFLSSSLGFAFSVSDGSANVTPVVDGDGNNFTVEAKPVNDTPTASVDKTGVVSEAGTLVFNTAGKPSITLSDVDGTGDAGPGALDNYNSETGVDELYVSLSDDVDHGELYLDSNDNGVLDAGEEFNFGDTLKKSEIESSLFKYKHDGTDGVDSFSDSFEITTNDAQGFGGADAPDNNSVGSPVKINIQIAPVNDDPIADDSTPDDPPLNTLNTGLRVPEGATGIIGGSIAVTGSTAFGGSEDGSGNSQLVSYDPDNTVTQIQYRITGNVSKGVLLLNGRVLGVDSTFTQDDLDNGRVTYRHNGEEGLGEGAVTDSFDFEVGDAGGGIYPTGTFDIEVFSNTNDPPTVTTPSGIINIDDYASGSNKIAGVSVGDTDTDFFKDFLQVTIRITDSNGNPFANDGDYSGYKITSSSVPLQGADFEIDDTKNGNGTFLELRGDRANINAYLNGLELGCTTDPDASLKLEVIVDDRIRDLNTGNLDTSLKDANGGENNQNAVPGGSPVPVNGTEFDAYNDKVSIHSAKDYNIVSDTVDLRVSTEDDPSVIGDPGSQTVLEDVQYTINGITVTDAESSGLGINITTTLSVGSGKLNIGSQSGVSVSGNNSGNITLTGHADDINTLLGKGVKYTSAANNNIDNNGVASGDVTLTVSVKEGSAAIGNEAAGVPGDDTVSLEIPINITPTNDAPTVNNSQGAVTLSDVDVLVNVGGFTLGDIDISGDPGGLTIGESEYVEVTVRLLDDANNPLPEASYQTDASDKAVLTSSSPGTALVDSVLNGSGKALQIRGTISQVQGYLDGLQLSLGKSLSETDSFYKVEVIVDDRSRDINGDLDASGIDANGGELNVNGSGLAVNILTNEIDPYLALPSIPLNTDSAARTVFLSSVNDPADITANNVTIDENTGVVNLNAGNANIIVDDPDDNGGQISATISTSTGLITGVGGSGGNVSGIGTNQISFTNITEAQLNLRLKDLSITLPDPDGGGSATSADWNGDFEVTIVVNDEGKTGQRPSSLPGDTGDPDSNPGDYSYEDDPGDGDDSELVTTRIIKVVVNPRNDSPVITGTSADPEFVVQDNGTGTLGGPLKLLQNGVQVEDVDILSDSDVNSFGGGKITISFDDYGDGDELSVAGGVLAGMNGAATGGSGADLVINLTDDATASQVASILEAVQFNNTNSNPLNNDTAGNNYERNFTIVLNDGNNNNDSGGVDGINDSGGLTAGPPHALDSNALTGTILFRTPPDATDNSNTIVKTASTITGDVRGDNDGSGVDSDNEDPINSLVVSKVESDGSNVGASISGTYGSIVINSDGTYTYTLNTSHADVVALSAGDPNLTESFTYTIKDTDNTTDTATLTINITGSNTNPDATDNTNSVTEFTSPQATGNIITDNDGFNVDSDPENDTLIVTDVDGTGVPGAGGNVVVNGTYGRLTINKDGSYTYDLDGNNADVIALNPGGFLNDVFVYTISDGNGGTDTANLTITIGGIDSTPVATDNTNSVTEGDVAPATGNVISDNDGSGVDNDPDGDNTNINVTKVNGAGGNVGSSVTGNYGEVTINANGTYSYTLDNTNQDVIDLYAGLKLTDTFTYQITDEDGDTASANLTITINGDGALPKPPIAINNFETVTIDKAVVNGNVITDDNGNGSDDDPDGPNANLLVTKVDGGSGNVGNIIDGKYGSVTINSDGTYTYNLDTSNPVFTSLKDGETLKETFTYEIKDVDDLTDSAELTILINGNNSNPYATDNLNSVKEDVNIAASGKLISDNDGFGVDGDPENDPLTVSVDNTTGTYGTLSVNSDGRYTYTLNNDHPDVKALNDGDGLRDVFTYKISDGNGGSDTAKLTITITGKNSAPNATDNTNTAQEDLKLSASGNLITDDDGSGLDNDPENDPLSVSVSNTTGAYGTLIVNPDGTYTYTLNNDHKDVKALGVEDEIYDVFTYTLEDGNGGSDTANLTITITGQNSDPVAEDNENSVEEDVKLTASGNLVTDDDGSGVDNDPENDPLTVSVDNTTGTYGTVIINPDGSYTYNLDNDHLDVKALGKGDELKDVFIYSIDDGNGGTDTAKLTITIKGVNSSPEATDNTNTAKEDEKLTATGNLITDDDGSGLDNDPENDDLTVTIDNLTGDYGTLIVNPDGSYTYNLNNDHTDVQNLGESDSITDSFVYTISDGNGGTDTANLTITISGVEEPVVIEPDNDKGDDTESGEGGESNSGFSNNNGSDDGDNFSGDNGFNDYSSNQNNFYDTMNQSNSGIPEIFLVGDAEDKVVQAGIEQNFAVSESIFQHTDYQEHLTYEASGANGEALPDWLSFDPETLTFRGTPPTGEGPTEVLVVITARDSSMNTAEAIFTIKVQKEIGEAGNKNFAENKNPGSDYMELIGLGSEFRAKPGEVNSFDSSKLFVRENGSPVKIQNFSASSADGSPLPDWVQIDPDTGKVTMNPPNGAKDIEIIIEGKDSYGNEATGRIKIDTDGDNNGNEIVDDLKGHPGLNAQFESIGVKGLHREADAILNSLNEMEIG